jgi:hypothetical protein
MKVDEEMKGAAIARSVRPRPFYGNEVRDRRCCVEGSTVAEVY